MYYSHQRAKKQEFLEKEFNINNFFILRHILINFDWIAIYVDKPYHNLIKQPNLIKEKIEKQLSPGVCQGGWSKIFENSTGKKSVCGRWQIL